MGSLEEGVDLFRALRLVGDAQLLRAPDLRHALGGIARDDAARHAPAQHDREDGDDLVGEPASARVIDLVPDLLDPRLVDVDRNLGVEGLQGVHGVLVAALGDLLELGELRRGPVQSEQAAQMSRQWIELVAGFGGRFSRVQASRSSRR